MTPLIGAEIDGIDLAAANGAETAQILRGLLLRHGVLVFRRQSLTREAHVRIASWFGRPERLPVGLPDHPEVVRIEHGPDAPPTENIWHADLSFLPEPPIGAVLRSVEVPDAGGDTLFADMRDVWLRLPDRIKEALSGLTAEHDIAKWSAEHGEELRAVAPVHRHPIVRMHPETGDPVLFVNPAYTTRVVELNDADSSAMLDYLFRQVMVPEVQCRVRWEAGTVVLWDNRSLLHYATGDYMPARRVMERVSIRASAAVAA